jgi:hypothetical protein
MKTNEMNLYQKINEIMKKIDGIEKGTTVQLNQSRSYTAVSHDDVTALLHKPLADMGIVVIPNIESVDVAMNEKEKEYQGKTTVSIEYLVKVNCSIEFVNADKPDERFKSHSFSYALDSGDKAVGKAYSMAIKYIYLKTFMLESYDEEESREHEHKYKKEYTSNQSVNNAPKADDKTKIMLAGGPTPSQVSYLKTLIEQKKYSKPVDFSKLTFDSTKQLIADLVAIKG